MNPVFWLLVILALAVIWLVLAPIFKHIGRSVGGMAYKAKKEMFDNEDVNEIKERDN